MSAQKLLFSEPSDEPEVTYAQIAQDSAHDRALWNQIVSKITEQYGITEEEIFDAMKHCFTAESFKQITRKNRHDIWQIKSLLDINNKEFHKALRRYVKLKNEPATVEE